MRTLAIVPGGVSDQLLFFPTLTDLKQNYPESQIDVVTEPRAVGAYRVCPSVQSVISFDFQDRNSLADWGNLLGSMREKQYEAVLSLTSDWNMGLALWLTGIPVRVGYAGPAAPFLTRVVPRKSDQYRPQMYHDLLQAVGIGDRTPDLAISVPRRDIEWAEAELKRLGMGGQGYVLVDSSVEATAQGSRLDSQRYPNPSWQRALQNLRDRQPDLPIVVVQWPEETELIGELRETGLDLKTVMPPDMGKLAALIASANVLISTNFASMQLAVAAQTFTIGLFGADNPNRWLPQSDKFFGLQPPSGRVSDIAPQQIIDALLG